MMEAFKHFQLTFLEAILVLMTCLHHSYYAYQEI